MPAKFAISRFLKRLLIFLVVVVAIWLIAIGLGKHLLNDHGITYDRLSFRFPSSATVTGLVVENDGLSLHAQHVEARWSWGALLNGNIRGQWFSVRDAAIRISPGPPTDATSGLPEIAVDRISLQNVSLTWRTAHDSVEVLLSDATGVGLRYDGTLVLDSLLNNRSTFTGWYAEPDSVHQHQAATGTFSVGTLPAFHLGEVVFADCAFLVHYKEHRYSISRFNLGVSGLSNKDVLNMTMHGLAFRYQDSLDVNIAVSAASVDQQNNATLNHFFIELPGLRISAPSLAMSGKGGFGIFTELDSSWVDTNLINFFFPSLRSSLPESSRIAIDGGLSYHNNRLEFDGTTVSLGNEATLSATGFVQSGSRGDSLRVDIHALTSSLQGLSRWAGFRLPEGQINLPIRMHGVVAGTYSALHSKGTLFLDQTPVRYETRLNQTSDNLRASFALQSPEVVPQTLLTAFENDLRVTGMNLNGTTEFRKSTLQHLQLTGMSDSVYLSNRWYHAPVIDLSYTPAGAEMALTSVNDGYDVRLKFKGDALSGEALSCTGSLRFDVPPIEGIELKEPTLTTSFHGTVVPKIPAIDLIFDTLKVKHDINRVHTASGHLEIKQLKDRTTQALLSIDNYLNVQLSLGPDFSAWISSDDLLERFPTAALTMNIHADTSLLKAVTGTTAQIEIDKLQVISGPGNIDASLYTDTLVFQGFALSKMSGTFTYRPGQLTGKLATPELVTPLTILENSKLEIVTGRDSAFTLTFDTYLPEIERPLGLSYRIASLRDGFRIEFGDSTFQLGLRRWQTDLNTTMFVSRSFDEFSGELQLVNGPEKAILTGEGDQLVWRLEKLDVFPIANILVAEPSIHGFINAGVSCNFKESKYGWTAALSEGAIDTVQFGNLLIDGKSTPGALSLSAKLSGPGYDASGIVEKPAGGTGEYRVDVNNIDLGKFSALLPVQRSILTVRGLLNAHLTGTYGGGRSMTGFVALGNTEIISPEYDIYFRSDNDSLLLKGTTSLLNNFSLQDRHGNSIVLDGQINLADPSFDIGIKTDKFRLLDRSQQKSTLTGEVDIACDIHIRRKKGDYNITGNLSTLSGSSLTYLYKSNVTIDDRQREIDFVSFEQPVAQAVDTRARRRRNRNPVKWDVSIAVGALDVNVLFSEVNQDHIRTTANGQVAFKTGTGAEPSAFGEVKSSTGDIAYHVPMISDLRMTINGAGIRWVGDVWKPLLSFSGSQTFRITPNEISSLWTNKTDRWPISIIAKVNDRPMNDLVLNFDLSSTNNQVSDWIGTLAPETREAYAVSLLLRGRINTGGAADVNLLTQAMVSKMNEISSRNIKSADVAFYDESRGPNSPDGSNNKIGYSISKGLINKKMRIVLGGSVDLSGQHDPSMPDVKVEYLLRQDPTVTMTAGRANVYTGVVDGNVDESSLGLTYIKRFRNLFSWRTKKKKE